MGYTDGRTVESMKACGNKNKMEGMGVFSWKDGRRYEGEYRNDRKEGYGEFQWPDGRMYKGSWKSGKQDGEGLFISDKGISRKGIWKEGKRISWVDEQGS